ncbi:hypothetical protein [Borrelia crocidurae]|uniref:hypothetical protein n=1 Tax=Borrelia crocidurae TaxID=29520 RepID=UPI001F57EEC1|nr:hypothetical protein [Borrelia crocidurae]
MKNAFIFLYISCILFILFNSCWHNPNAINNYPKDIQMREESVKKQITKDQSLFLDLVRDSLGTKKADVYGKILALDISKIKPVLDNMQSNLKKCGGNYNDNLVKLKKKFKESLKDITTNDIDTSDNDISSNTSSDNSNGNNIFSDNIFEGLCDALKN